MKRIITLVLCTLVCLAGMAQNMTSEQKEKAKDEIKLLQKDGWKCAGDHKLSDQVMDSREHMADTVNYVCGQGKGAGIDAKAAIATATEIAQQQALDKLKAHMHAIGFKKYNSGSDFKHLMTIYKVKDGNGYAIVRVALAVPKVQKQEQE